VDSGNQQVNSSGNQQVDSGGNQQVDSGGNRQVDSSRNQDQAIDQEKLNSQDDDVIGLQAPSVQAPSI
jgi:hypothetical protein